MTCILKAMNFDSLPYDDTFAVFEINESNIECDDRSVEKLSFHDSRCSLLSLDSFHSESTVAYYSITSIDDSHFDDECEGFNDILPCDHVELISDATNVRKVNFGGVAVRGYPVVIGCQDIPCPLELDWEFDEYYFKSEEDYRVSSNSDSKPRSLSYHERRQIIAASQDIPFEDVKQLEQEMMYLQNARQKLDFILSHHRKRTVKRVDSPPIQPRGENKNTSTMTRTSTYAVASHSTSSNNETLSHHWERTVKRVDSPPIQPRGENKNTRTMTRTSTYAVARNSTSSDNETTTSKVTRRDAVPRRPSNDYIVEFLG